MSSNPSMTSNFHIKLQDGDNYFIAVITNGGRTKTLTFKITVPSNMPSSNRLADMILADNTVIENLDPVVERYDNEYGSYTGLYKNTSTNSGDPTYYFYGTPTNNYVNYAGKLWRIVRINEDGTVRLILDEKIDSTEYVMNNVYSSAIFNVLSTTNNFDYSNTSDPDYVTKYNAIYDEMMGYSYYTSDDAPMNYRYRNSNDPLVKDALQAWYQTNIASSNNYSKWIAHKSGNYFCIAFNLRGSYDKVSTSTITYGRGDDYKNVDNLYNQSKFTCYQDAFGHQYVDSNIGLLTNYEYLSAVGDRVFTGSGTHVSSYLDKEYYWWISNSAGVDIDFASINNLVGASEEMLMTTSTPNGGAHIRPVINLKAATTATKNQSGVYVVD